MRPRYIGRNCRRCQEPLQIVAGGGSDQLQRQKVICETCARKLAAPRANRAWDRHDHQRRRRNAEQGRMRRKMAAAG